MNAEFKNKQCDLKRISSNIVFVQLCAFLLLTTAPHVSAFSAGMQEDAAIECDACEEWNAPQKPFRIFGSTWYVGTAGLSSILIDTGTGLVLLDGALSQSAAQIERNIRTLGFDSRDVKVIVNSHAHFDHAGGISALQRHSNATVYASVDSIDSLMQGRLQRGDPQFVADDDFGNFPAVGNVQLVRDNESILLGELRLTANYTPGHTKGSTTWIWESCDDATCLRIVYADSLSAVSMPGFRFTGANDSGDLTDSYRVSIDRVRKLPCDILLSPHPMFFDMHDKIATLEVAGQLNPFIDTNACKNYADYFADWLQRRVDEELE